MKIRERIFSKMIEKYLDKSDIEKISVAFKEDTTNKNLLYVKVEYESDDKKGTDYYRYDSCLDDYCYILQF